MAVILALLNCFHIPLGPLAFSRVIPEFKKFTHLFMREKILNFDQNVAHPRGTVVLVAGKGVPCRLPGSSYGCKFGYFLIIDSCIWINIIIIKL